MQAADQDEALGAIRLRQRNREFAVVLTLAGILCTEGAPGSKADLTRLVFG